MSYEFATIVLGGINASALTLFGLYLRSMKSDQRGFLQGEKDARLFLQQKINDVDEKITSLKNGCFERHAIIERELGRNEQTMLALHRRVDGAKNVP